MTSRIHEQPEIVTVEPRARRRPASAVSGPAGYLLALQSSAGNAAVARLVQVPPSVQRCGTEVHAGCPCAETADGPENAGGAAPAVQRQVEPGAASPGPAVQRQVVEEPAGGCGVCDGPKEAGQKAHALVQTEFEISYPLSATELPFSAPGDDNGRLDLVLPTPTGMQIGEIKPGNAQGYLDGQADMLWYLAALRKAFPKSTITPLMLPIGPDIGPFPNPRSPDCAPQQLRVNPPVNGVYGYTCSPTFSQLKRSGRCGCDGKRQKAPAKDPVRTTITDFIRELVRTGESAATAIPEFLRTHPEARDWLIAAGVTIIVATILEDLATLGVGLVDDPATLSIALALIRAAR